LPLGIARFDEVFGVDPSHNFVGKMANEVFGAMPTGKSSSTVRRKPGLSKKVGDIRTRADIGGYRQKGAPTSGPGRAAFH